MGKVYNIDELRRVLQPGMKVKLVSCDDSCVGQIVEFIGFVRSELSGNELVKFDGHTDYGPESLKCEILSPFLPEEPINPPEPRLPKRYVVKTPSIEKCKTAMTVMQKMYGGSIPSFTRPYLLSTSDGSIFCCHPRETLEEALGGQESPVYTYEKLMELSGNTPTLETTSQEYMEKILGRFDFGMGTPYTERATHMIDALRYSNFSKLFKKGNQIMSNIFDKIKDLALSEQDRILRAHGLEDEHGKPTEAALNQMEDELAEARWQERRLEVGDALIKIQNAEKK